MFKNLINILAAPKETFISIKEKPTVLFPLLLSVLALISVQWGYFNIVDRDFLIEELIVQAQAFVDVPEDQLRANKAIGAKRHQILLQFLFESLLLCLLGGFIGLCWALALALGSPQRSASRKPMYHSGQYYWPLDFQRLSELSSASCRPQKRLTWTLSKH